MKVLVVSHAAAMTTYQDKLRRLIALHPDVHVTLVVPHRWREGNRWRVPAAETQPRLSVRPLPVVGPGKQYVHFYPTLAGEFVRTNPDLLLVEEEPPTLAAAEAALLRSRWQTRTKLIFLTWENLSQRWRGVRGALYPRLERYVHGESNAAIAGTRHAREVLLARGYAKPVFVCPQWGIDCSRFSPRPGDDTHRQAPPHPGTLVVGYVGRLLPEKGIDLLLRALAELPDGVRLVIVGGGPYHDALQAMARPLTEAGRVRWLGSMAYEEVAARVRSMDVLVLPSRSIANWREQFGRVVLEAMACGTPVVGSTCGAIPEVIGDAGLLFPEDDWQALAGQLRRLLTSPDLRHRLSVAGRKRAQTEFSTDRIAELHYRVFQQVLTGTGAQTK